MSENMQPLDNKPEQPAVRQWVRPGLALAGVAALLVCVVALLAFGALAWLRGPRAVSLAGLAGAPNRAGAATGAPSVRPPDARTAVLADVRGLVELQDAAGAWHSAAPGQVLAAGQRVRTGALSGVTLAYYDGSYSVLGAGSELLLDELNAVPAGARVVALTQWLGESTHTVAPSAEAGARFVVNTPAGSGTAKGTVFHVLVSAGPLVRFDVAEGAVEVTHQSTSVQVVAGQATIVAAGQPPSEPTFLISGEGRVQATGQAWQIAGRAFVTHPNTLIFGEPVPGDWVRFEGRVIADGTRVLDKVVLLRRAAGSGFVLVGPVTAIGASEWVIGGQVVRVDGQTELAPGLAMGAWVEARGGIDAAGAWWASSIQPLAEPADGLAFRFVGTIQAQADTLWTISGISVTVSAETVRDDGLAVGQVVVAEGRVLDDGRWLAESLRRAGPNEGAFEISGALESLEPLTVAGIRLVTAAWTEREAGLAVGDQVRVTGRILDDGTWLAERIERLEAPAGTRFEFVGVIDTLEPWVVATIPLTVDEATEIDEGLAAGDLVRVEGERLPDGTWLAHEIRRVDDDLGCLDLRAVVSRVEGNQVFLLDGQVIDLEHVSLVGELHPATVIVIYGCLDEDGQFVVITIIAIYQLPELPVTPTPGPTPANEPDSSNKVTICHRPPGNPDNAHTLSVGASAVPAHLGHGDTLGPCP